MKPGFLVIEKETGTRSTSCVSVVKRVLGRNVRVGHGGTLDSTAGGILVLLVGRATRASRYVMALPKTYETIARFGLRTSTDDMTGETLEEHDAGYLDDGVIDRAVLSLLGLRDQIPPSISAVRVAGKRAHFLARSGESVVLSPRPVMVTSIARATSISHTREVKLLIRCHRGTYIRSLVRDLGEILGCGATVVALERTSIGPFDRAGSISSALLGESGREYLETRIIPVSEIHKGFTTYRVHPFHERALLSGKPVPMDQMERISWGGSLSESLILLLSERFVSFAAISRTEGFSTATPVTTIETGDVE
ncbi:MAG: tRNA pseudouridine(55) synthase TruB [Thermovirgaceae bacterium]|nr:tRNA pseudouridine(55) synthase TruB [Thermovirgaceae bacterium]